jgi:hypothetical protein
MDVASQADEDEF